MSDKQLKTLCDLATEAHHLIQQNFEDINPVVGVNHKMRSNGVPADAMTIDCLKSGKRIILVLHDQQPDIIHYQFSFKDKDPDSKFESIPFNELTANTIYEWMRDYFSNLQ
ncbi:MAG: hypothetical protein OQL19_01230 [Gammaproteobacteria bacterium]|nr:hypothetical protein [Gammaproteobacteria bacterium]